MVRFGVAIIPLVAVGLTWVVEIPQEKQVIELVPKFGTVTFAHRAHSDRLGGECIVCHHTYEGPGDSFQSCYECHRAVLHREAAVVRAASVGGEQTADAPPKAEHAFHTLCIDCHASERAARRPTGPSDSCRDCHV